MHKGADIVLQCLRAEGVGLVFGYPGGAIMPLYDALEGSGVRHILTRHEQGAVFAAEGYARVTGEVGVAMATSGPGATNLVTGIADAKMDSVPLVCITGQVRSALIGTDAFQETDVFGVTLSLTKWSRLVRTIDEIPEAIAEGFHWARSGRPGPVVIDIPTDLLQAKIVHFEIDPAQLDRVRPCDLPVIGNLADTIPAFEAELRRHTLPDFSGWRSVACGADRAELDPRGLAQPTIRFLDELFSRLPEDSVVITDVGQHQMWAAQRYRSSSPRGFITSGGLGSMGFALPAAVGAQLAKPDTCVVCVSGDGGFQMNIQELASVHRLGLPVKLVIIDNKYLGMVRQWQQLFYERNYAETDLSDNPDFVEIAKAYKIHAFRMKEDVMREFPVSQETGDQIDRFLRSPEPELLVFDCAPEANVFPMVPAGAALSEMLLEEK